MRFLFFSLFFSFSPMVYAVFATEKINNGYIVVGSSTPADMMFFPAISQNAGTLGYIEYSDEKKDVYARQEPSASLDCPNEKAASDFVNRYSGETLTSVIFPGGGKRENTLIIKCYPKGMYGYYIYNQYIPPVPTKSCSAEVLNHVNLITQVGKSTRGTAAVRVICNPLSVRVRVSVTTLDMKDTIVMNGGVRVKISACDGCGSTAERDIIGPYTFNPLFVVTDTGTLGQTVSGFALFKVDIL
ncbi:hypothetical protein ACUTQ5_13715 [Serratia sp. NA_112.1]|uniref:hypothetical protein n=1 Tax=unclassified Serratia (in: enterobacteria) TaxID=2647522 RepID=UPI004046BEBF